MTPVSASDRRKDLKRNLHDDLSYSTKEAKFSFMMVYVLAVMHQAPVCPSLSPSSPTRSAVSRTERKLGIFNMSASETDLLLLILSDGTAGC